MPEKSNPYTSAWRAMIIAWQRAFITRWTVGEITAWRQRVQTGGANVAR